MLHQADEFTLRADLLHEIPFKLGSYCEVSASPLLVLSMGFPSLERSTNPIAIDRSSSFLRASSPSVDETQALYERCADAVPRRSGVGQSIDSQSLNGAEVPGFQ